MREVRPIAYSLDCLDAYGIVVEVADGRIVRLGADPDHRSRAGHSAARSTTTCLTGLPPQGECRSDLITLQQLADRLGLAWTWRGAPRTGSTTLRLTLECGDGVPPDSVLVAKGDWAKYDRGLNVLTEPRYAAGTGVAYYVGSSRDNLALHHTVDDGWGATLGQSRRHPQSEADVRRSARGPIAERCGSGYSTPPLLAYSSRDVTW